MRIVAAAILVSMCSAPLQAAAQDAPASFAPLGDESDNFSVESVLDSLNHPAGLALRLGSNQAEPHELFISESGAGRVLRIATDMPRETSEAIAGFSQISYGEEPALQLGPTALAFLTRTKLVVCGGGQQSTPGLLSVYLLPDDSSAVDAAKPDHAAGPIHAGDSLTNSKRVFFGVAKTESALFSTWAGASEGWILKSGIEANRLAYLQPLVTPEQSASLGVPTGLAINPSPRPPFLVVAYRGNFETPRDSTLAFYRSADASLVMSLETGLHDISALAYSPTGQLYAADFAKNEEQSGGIYRLDDAYLAGQQTCQAVKVAAIPRPTALAFTPAGILYVTAFGASDSESQGALIKITGEL